VADRAGAGSRLRGCDGDIKIETVSLLLFESNKGQ